KVSYKWNFGDCLKEAMRRRQHFFVAELFPRLKEQRDSAPKPLTSGRPPSNNLTYQDALDLLFAEAEIAIGDEKRDDVEPMVALLAKLSHNDESVSRRLFSYIINHYKSF